MLRSVMRYSELSVRVVPNPSFCEKGVSVILSRFGNECFESIGNQRIIPGQVIVHKDYGEMERKGSG